MTPLLAGLLTAGCFGFCDYAGALATRRIGSLWVGLGMHTVGVVLLVLVLTLLNAWPPLTLDLIPIGFGVGTAGGLGLYFLYRALALGPLAVCSPIVAAHGALAVILVVAVTGVLPTGVAVAAIIAVLIGILLASTGLRDIAASFERPLPGLRFAFLGMVAGAFWATFFALAARDHDPIAVVFAGRVGQALFVGFATLVSRTPVPVDRRRTTLLLILVIATLDVAGTLTFVTSLAGAEPAVVITAASIAPIFPAAIGIIFHKERLGWTQYIGVGVILAGLMALGWAG